MIESLPPDVARFAAASPIPMTFATPFGPDRVLVAANPRFCELTGYSESEILGRDCRFLQGEATQPESRDAMRRFFEDGASAQARVAIVNYRKDGKPFINFVFLSKLTGTEGQVRFLLASQFDVTHSASEAAETYERELGAGLKSLRTLGQAHRLVVETSLASLANSAHAVASARFTLADIAKRAS